MLAPGSFEEAARLTPRVCTSYETAARPRAPRHAAALARLDPRIEVVFIDAAAHGASPRPVERSGGGLSFKPGSHEDLARTLKRLRDEPTVRGELSERARLYALSEGNEAAQMRVMIAALIHRSFATRGATPPAGTVDTSC